MEESLSAVGLTSLGSFDDGCRAGRSSAWRSHRSLRWVRGPLLDELTANLDPSGVEVRDVNASVVGTHGRDPGGCAEQLRGRGLLVVVADGRIAADGP